MTAANSNFNHNELGIIMMVGQKGFANIAFKDHCLHFQTSSVKGCGCSPLYQLN